MKQAIIILNLFALIIGSCGLTQNKKPLENEVAQSDIRPNEELVLGKEYTDSFEYIDYRDGEYRGLIYLKKNNKEIILYDDTPETDTVISELNRGDKIIIKWRLERFYHEGGGEYYIGEFAEKITKTEDGE